MNETQRKALLLLGLARKARKLFHELEGVDIYSAAGVALASLINAVAAGKVEKDATVMLNVTGGGWRAPWRR